MPRLAEAMTHFQQRWKWQWFWGFMLLLSVCGLLYIADLSRWFGRAHEKIAAQSVGGWLGYATFEYAFWMLGTVGAIIVYSTLCLISLLLLTNFQLGPWLGQAEMPTTGGWSETVCADEISAIDCLSRIREERRRRLESV